jgi:hypothetical protein
MPRACDALHSAQLEIANATLAACDELRIRGPVEGPFGGRQSNVFCLTARRSPTVTVWRQWQTAFPPHAPSTPKRHRVRVSNRKFGLWINLWITPTNFSLRARVLATKEAEKWV